MKRFTGRMSQINRSQTLLSKLRHFVKENPSAKDDLHFRHVWILAHLHEHGKIEYQPSPIKWSVK